MVPAVEAACFRGPIDVARLFLQTYHSKYSSANRSCAVYAFDATMDGGRESIVRLAPQYDPFCDDPWEREPMAHKFIHYFSDGVIIVLIDLVK